MISWIHQVSAVGTATQIEVIALNVVWACAAGTGIYAIQFFGAGDHKNLKRCFGLSISCAAFVGILTYGVITFFSAAILAQFHSKFIPITKLHSIQAINIPVH